MPAGEGRVKEGGNHIKMERMCRLCAKEASIKLGEKDAIIEELRYEVRQLKSVNNGWGQMGCLRSGEAVYCRRGGVVAVERDHEFLVEPTREELNEIIDMV